MDLHALSKTLFQEEHLPAIVEDATDAIDADHVKVAIEIDGFSEPLVLQIMHVETDPEVMSGLEMIQLYAPIPVELTEEAVEQIVWTLPEINEVVPLIGFNLHLEDNFVYFRHVLLAPEGEAGRRVVTEAVWMARFALDTFATEFAALGRRE